MKGFGSVVAALIFCVVFGSTTSAEAGWLFGRRVYSRTTTVTTSTYRTPVRTAVSSLEVATAQGVANIMARLGRVGHFGGNRGYEGCGMASTPQGAYSICCYANSGMATVDVGYAQGANGMWYCCRRYSR